MNGFQDRFWEIICGFKYLIFQLLIFEIVLSVLILISFILVSNQASYVILQVDAIIVFVSIFATVYLLVKCD